MKKISLFKGKNVKDLPLMPHKQCELVVIFAVAENEWVGVEDLLDSLDTYLDCTYEILAIDDSTTDGTYERLQEAGVWLVRNPEKLGLSGLNLTLRRGFRSALALFDSPIFLKMDPDALLIGEGLLKEVSEVLSQNSKIGLLGTYKIDWDGKKRDLSYWRKHMLRRYKDLGRAYGLALENGYEVGDGVQGGAYILSRECLMGIDQMGWFDTHTDYQPSVNRGLAIAEDSLITMLTYATGFRVQEFGGPGQAFGLDHGKLPMKPEELITQGRLVAHAIKYKDEVSLNAREYFRKCRQAYRQKKNCN